MKSKLLARVEVAERTVAVELEKPPGFTFAAGQALELKLLGLEQTDAEGDSRAFSIASAPADERLRIATRLRDTAFKRALKTQPLGAAVELDGPFGSMTLHKNAAKTAVFVAGGIGITPFMSMLRQAAAEQSTRAFVLVTCNRRPEDSPFGEELASLSRTLKSLRLLETMTQADKSAHAWTGRRGRITPELIAEAAPDVAQAVCYAAGPPKMVAAMRQALVAAGADEDSIRAEEFPGY